MRNRWSAIVFLIVGMVASPLTWGTEDTTPPLQLGTALLPSDILLASSDNAHSMSTLGATEEFHESWITTNKIHQYLGIGSLALATLAIIAPKEEGKSPHHYMALSAAYLGGAAVASGLTFHFRDLSLTHAWRDPDNLHALLALIGTAGYFLAVSNAPNEMHPAYGMAGFASMALAIKITW